MIKSPILESCDSGWCVPDPLWCAKNLMPVCIPGLPNNPTHWVMAHVDVVAGLLRALREANYVHNWAPTTIYAWSPRRMMLDRLRPLSLHAYGLAVDIDQDSNGYGTKGNLPPEVVKCFTNEGFKWGGHWSTPDPMHFEVPLETIYG